MREEMVSVAGTLFTTSVLTSPSAFALPLPLSFVAFFGFSSTSISSSPKSSARKIGPCPSSLSLSSSTSMALIPDLLAAGAFLLSACEVELVAFACVVAGVTFRTGLTPTISISTSSFVLPERTLDSPVWDSAGVLAGATAAAVPVLWDAPTAFCVASRAS